MTARGRSAARRTDALLLAAGIVLFGLAAALIDRHHVATAERTVFRAVNDRTVVPFALVWPVMQLGNFLVIPVTAAAAALTRRWRLAAGLLVGGLAAYLIAAYIVRRVVVRGRPASLLDHVHIRGATPTGLGFVSGHVAVATALTAIAWPYLARRGRILAATAVALVALARMYVGAHLPLDVVGGAGLGLAVAGAVRLALPAPPPRRRRLRARARHG